MSVTACEIESGARMDGDTHAVVARYKDMVYRIALTHTRYAGDADDVFQDVFLAYHRKQPELNGEEHLKAWLITTTVNCARRVSMNSWRTKVIPMRPEDMEQPEVFHFNSEVQDELFTALGKLPEAYKTVLHLFYFEDLSVNMIAAMLELEAGTVKMRLSRGRGLMRTQMSEGGYFDER
ncbi:MAG: sigma-70 family RNA polymerase sigma factor [Propionibacteriaceae bacterium]|jgi:RNA polymerase sigma-70 factor (ECF subfamily)|nr:sigma-70 family RNA polymerase sigma factor [Propionibacteriaceae bacterium]